MIMHLPISIIISVAILFLIPIESTSQSDPGFACSIKLKQSEERIKNLECSLQNHRRGCPAGWVSTMVGCYQMLSSTCPSGCRLEDALEECRKLGGVLAQPRNEMELKIVSAMVVDREGQEGWWTGLTAVGINSTTHKVVAETCDEDTDVLLAGQSLPLNLEFGLSLDQSGQLIKTGLEATRSGLDPRSTLKPLCQYSRLDDLCPEGFAPMIGDVYGAGSIDGWHKVTDKRECSRICEDNPACSSFEYSQSEKICNINWQRFPSSNRTFNDYVFCSKSTDNLVPFTVSSDSGLFWMVKGEKAIIFNQDFTFWAFDSEKPNTTEYNVLFKRDPFSLKITEGRRRSSDLSWTMLYSFWAYSSKEPGTQPISVKVEPSPYRMELSRGENIDLWDVRSFIIWAFADIPKKSHICNVTFEIEKPLLDHFGNNMKAVEASVDKVISEVNQIYKGSIFEQYGITMQSTNIEASGLICTEQDCENVEYLLDKFTEDHPNGDVCLKYLLTYRDFQYGTTGLGWKGSVCPKKFKTRFQLFKNTGVVTFLNHNRTRTEASVGATMAHEIGHNFGANHDEDTDCGFGGHLMSSVEQPEHPKRFSSCSSRCIRENIRAVLDSDRADIGKCPSTKELLWNNKRRMCLV